jgi:Tfp pilus assembly protein PilF
MAEKKRSLSYKPIKIDFNALSGDEFENMCYWLIDDIPEYRSVHQIGVQNTKAVDISAKKGKDLYYFQVKRYKDLTNQNIKKILELMKEKINEDGITPDAFVIMTSSESGEKRRLYMKEEAKRQGLKIKRLEIWDGNKVEKLLYKHKKVLNHFYKDGANVTVKRSSLSTILTVLGIAVILFLGVVITGLTFPDIPIISDFSRLIFGKVGQSTGYIQEFAQDLDELIIVREIDDEVIKSVPLPGTLRAKLIASYQYLVTNNEEGSIEYANEILSKDEYKTLPEANFIIGTAKFIINEKKTKVKQYFQRGTQGDKSFWQIYNNFGVILYNLGNVDKALEQFLKSEQLYKESPEVYRNLSIAYNRMGQSGKALASLLKAQELTENAGSKSGNIIADNTTSKHQFRELDKTQFKKDINTAKKEYVSRVENIENFEKNLDKVNIKSPEIIDDAKQMFKDKNRDIRTGN